MALLTADDVKVFVTEDDAVVSAVVDDVVALAAVSVPELAHEDTLSDTQKAAVKSILRGAAIRYIETGMGTVAGETAPGGFSRTLVTSNRKSLLYPSEIENLKKAVGSKQARVLGKAFAFGSGHNPYDGKHHHHSDSNGVDPTVGGGTGTGTGGSTTTPTGPITISQVSGLSAALAARITAADPRLSDARTPLPHIHNINDVGGLVDALNARALVNHTHGVSAISGLADQLAALSDDISRLKSFDETAVSESELAAAYADITTRLGEYLTFPGAAAQFAFKTDLNAINDNIQNLLTAVAGKADYVHTHIIADVEGLRSELDGIEATIAAIQANGTSGGSGTAINLPISIADVSGLRAELDAIESAATALNTAVSGKAGVGHKHVVADTTGLQQTLDGLAANIASAVSQLQGKVDVSDPRLTDARVPLQHQHGLADLPDVVTGLASKVDTTDPRLSDARHPLTHTHSIADVDNLVDRLANLAPLLHTHGIADVTGLADQLASISADIATLKAFDQTAATDAELAAAYADVTSRLGDYLKIADASSTYATQTAFNALQTALNGLSTTVSGKANAVHSHVIGDVTNLQSNLDSINASVAANATAITGKANAVHGHAIADVANLQSNLDSINASVAANATAITGKVSNTDSRLSDARTPLAHSHAVADVTGLQSQLDGINSSVTANANAIATKANSSDVYLKTQTYSKTEVDAKLPSSLPSVLASVGVRSGQIIRPHVSGFSTATLLQNLIYFTPVVLETDTSINGIVANPVGSTAVTCTLGIYNSNSYGEANSLILNAGSAGIATGSKSVSFTAQTLTRGLYWIALLPTSGNMSMNTSYIIDGVLRSVPLSVIGRFYGYRVSGSSGLPTSVTTASLGEFDVPQMYLKAA